MVPLKHRFRCWEERYAPAPKHRLMSLWERCVRRHRKLDRLQLVQGSDSSKAREAADGMDEHKT